MGRAQFRSPWRQPLPLRLEGAQPGLLLCILQLQHKSCCNIPGSFREHPGLRRITRNCALAGRRTADSDSINLHTNSHGIQGAQEPAAPGALGAPILRGAPERRPKPAVASCRSTVPLPSRRPWRQPGSTATLLRAHRQHLPQTCFRTRGGRALRVESPGTVRICGNIGEGGGFGYHSPGT